MPIPVADSHNDLLLAVQFARDHGRDDLFGEFWLPQLRQGGVVLQVLPIWTDHQFVSEGALRRALQMVETTRQLATRYAADVALVTTVSELDAALEGGRIALVLAFEGVEPIGADIDLFDTFWQLGVRMASLTWNRRTPFADGLSERRTGAGLTRMGVRAIERMESLGMIVDVSHLSDAGFDSVASVASRPFVASHSSCRAVHEHPRNLRDDQLRTISASGGFVGVNGIADFVGGDGTVDAYVEHVAHAVEVIGAEHVGLGVDFIVDVDEQTLPVGARYGDGPCIDGLLRPSDLPGLAALLSSRIGAESASLVCAATIVDAMRRLLPT